MKQFLTLLVKENPYQEIPNFRGAYLTSGTQEGLPLARLLGNLRTAFAHTSESTADQEEQVIEQEDVETKSFFIKDLFSQVIFAEKNLSAKNKYRLRLQGWLKTASIFIALGLFVLAFTGYSTSLTSNILWVNQGVQTAKKLDQHFTILPTNAKQAIDQMMPTFNYYQSLVNYRQHVPLHLRLGLYRGNTQIVPLSQMMMQIMQRYFAVPIDQQLVQKLRHYQTQWKTATLAQHKQLRGAYYTTFKAYLMLNFPYRIDVKQAVPVLSKLWVTHLNPHHRNENVNYDELLSNGQYRQLVAFYMQNLARRALENQSVVPHQINADLVRAVRHQLYTRTNANNLYAQIVSVGQANVPAMSIHRLVTGFGSNLLMSNQPLPGMYTKQAWHQFVAPMIQQISQAASHGDWVMEANLSAMAKRTLPAVLNRYGDHMSAGEMSKELKALYFSEYAQAWFRFMRSVRVEPFASLNEASSQLNTLANADGPMVELLRKVASNLDVRGDDEQLLPALRQPFAGVLQVIQSKSDNLASDQIKSYLSQMTAIESDFQQLAASSNTEQSAQRYAARLLSGEGGSSQLYRSMISTNMLVNRIDDNQARAALQSMLMQPIRESWRSILQAATQGLEQQWQNQVMSEYQQTIASRFPFNIQATQDAAMNDVVNFMQPKVGMLWSFVNTYLKPFLANNGRQWEQKTWLGIGAGFSQHFLAALTTAKHISDGLFSLGTNQVGFRYQLMMKPTVGLSQTVLTANGHTVRYYNGPEIWRSAQWPGELLSPESYLGAVASRHRDNPASQTASGPWSFFHLLSKAQMIKKQGEDYQFNWWLQQGDSHGYRIHLLLRSNTQFNVFASLLNGKFSLPLYIFSQEHVS